MTHGMDPGRMTPAERADEVGMLLSLAMTGQHVSGPRFFGLANSNKEDA